MTPLEVEKYYGSRYKFSIITGMSRTTITNWINKGFIPLFSQIKLAELTNGELKVDEKYHKLIRRFE